MSLKSTIFTSLVTLSLLMVYRTYSYTSPLAYTILAKFEKLEGKIKITQIDKGKVRVTGQFKKGFSDVNPDNYKILLGHESETFTDQGIKTKPPGTEPFNFIASGNAFALIDKSISITYKDVAIDQAIFLVSK
ncbi:8725_t:CDS:1 [Funneliformis geosporum]|uniref:11820_t:CDS:1 n=1 Tax=Funneliformis geosporum TaxID=1117311 RepID=A0A9W4WTK6_9GLOM|nr:8725_t:CDS:1 [Funneliformis geosporum]CAI2171159.1 11820_t:CDS:1 [Funneliformis geosporum]